MNRRRALLGLFGGTTAAASSVVGDDSIAVRGSSARLECLKCGSCMVVVLCIDPASDIYECSCSPGAYVRSYRASVKAEMVTDPYLIREIHRKEERNRATVERVRQSLNGSYGQ